MIVDDHTLFREGLREMLELDGDIVVVGEAGDGIEAVRKCVEVHPDVVLMDINLSGLSGILATKLIREQCPLTNVIILTMYEDDEYISGAIKAGALGYLHKTATRDELVRAIRVVHAGEPVIQPRVAKRILGRLADARERHTLQAGGKPQLTLREIEILRLICQGTTDKQIASVLGISKETVKSHVQSILRKLNAANRSQAVASAIRGGLIH